VQFIEAVQTAFVNTTYQIEARLARWILMCHDREDGDELLVTHDFMAVMLGVQRSSATLAVQSLEGNRLIKAGRGRMTVLDRQRLIEVADVGYGLPEAEYARLIEGA
jgi:CRP-like cAMP-binding protein